MHKEKCPAVSAQFVQKVESHDVVHENENEHSHLAQQNNSSFW